jgi:ribonuclease HI
VDILNIYTDGASRGNPGHSGIGVVIFNSDGKEVIKLSRYIGKKTNNEAEYLAIIEACKLIEKFNLININKCNFFMDSQLVQKQILGEYQIKSKNIAELNLDLKKRLNKFQSKNIELKFNWVKREENKIADELANKGIDENKNKSNENIKKINNIDNNNSNSNLIVNKAFFGKINCLKVQLSKNKDIYFHIGLLKNNSWDWEKVKMSDIEIGEIINILKKDRASCSFFHKFDKNTTQIWCRKDENSFNIKIKDKSKNLSIGEFEVLRIILEEIIKKVII